MGRQIEIAILDDHVLFLDAISLLIKGLNPIYNVSCYSSPDEVLKRVEDGLKFDLILCDLIMKTMNGLAFLGAVRSHSKSTPIVILSGINTSPPISDIKRMGGNGFVHKSAKNSEFSKAIEVVLSGGAFFDTGLGKPIIESAAQMKMRGLEENQKDELRQLSARQIEIMRLIANGYANKEIARSLTISENTVKTHLKQIFRELGVNKRTACVRKAQALGLI